MILTADPIALGAELTLVMQIKHLGHSVSWQCTALGEVALAPKSCR